MKYTPDEHIGAEGGVTVQVRLSLGGQVVEGEAFGHFAVTPALFVDADGNALDSDGWWSVTHIPTGHTVTAATAIRRREMCVDLARAFQRIVPEAIAAAGEFEARYPALNHYPPARKLAQRWSDLMGMLLPAADIHTDRGRPFESR